MQRTSIADDFLNFQSEFPLQKVRLPRSDLEWCYYQAGAPERVIGACGGASRGRLGAAAGVSEAVVFLHGTSGSAGAFFYQVEALSEKGYRVISAQYPAYYSVEDWCKGFDHFLDATACRSAHLFGAGVGGFLVQHFAEKYPQRVKSLMLCNGFATTRDFAERAGMLATAVHFTPAPLLRKVMLDSFPQCGMELPAKQAIDWIAAQVVELSGDDLAARLSLNCTASTVGAINLGEGCMTLLEASGDTMVPDEVRRHLRQRYPQARLAQLKACGDFPYLSRPEEVTLFVEVHLRSLGVVGRSHEAPSPALVAALAEAAALAEQAAATPGASQEGRSRYEWTDERGPVQTPALARRAWRNPFQDDDPLL